MVCGGLIRPSLTRDATDTAAECVSAKPAAEAAISTPASPNQSCAAAAASSTTARMAAKVSAVVRLKALPCVSCFWVFCFSAHSVKAPP